MKKNNLLVNMMFFTKRGQRIAAFGEYFGIQLVINTIICSKNDNFSRKFAWSIWNKHSGIPIDQIKKELGVTINQVTIPTTPGNEAKDFVEHLKYKYYKIAQVPVLMNMVVSPMEIDFYKIISKGFKKK